ncbi:MAG: hypothetical protein JXA14_03310 [Anaerolineae bacterium]|nr:hypothetical protein [Anaerolineae bacterium]
MTQSSIGWIDFSEQDRRRMIEVISLFKERDTRDELGLGSIRNAFADLFFPGTTTLQTRARYFLFVPWFYLYFEERKVPSRRIVPRLRQDEVKLMHALQAAGETEGIIGQRSGASLHRFPSSIYWNGLRQWGILRYPGSREQYHRSLDGFYQRQRDRLIFEDGEPVAGWADGNWDANLPPIPEGFPDKASFQLEPEEADYLRDRLLLSCPDSLLATLVDRSEPADDPDYVWLHPQLECFPQHQLAWITHAQNFSVTMYVAILLYNLMLAELRQDEVLIEEYLDGFDQWQTVFDSYGADLNGWDRDAFWRLVTDIGQIPWSTQRFVNDWLDILLPDHSLSDLVRNVQARALVHSRETWLKRGRSRFESRRHLEMWSGAAGLAPLDYRWNVARRIVNDILRGLEVG